MYCLKEMIDMGLPKGKTWPSDLHKRLSIKLLIGNPNIKDMDTLQESIKIIFKIPEEEISSLTYEKLTEYGFNVGIFI